MYSSSPVVYRLNREEQFDWTDRFSLTVNIPLKEDEVILRPNIRVPVVVLRLCKEIENSKTLMNTTYYL